MGAIVTWWPESMAKDMTNTQIVLMRYDWPDERIYQVGIYDKARMFPWTDGHGGMLQPPDYFTPIDGVLEFIKIPVKDEYTYKVTKEDSS